ncbi:ABC transporter ATP-binding protein [Pauljensenia sp. UMB6358]|uniref:ABC transporter ATP-binding protein n=1 Tax=Actinomycetaceae TaxID=2049 RepID=UPI0015C6E556|nr:MULTISPECIES: ABC transporter ATP-binding protein [Actinomycetaceae]MDK7122479.1 ABC transporter ATP-binding protein [Pauljensenia sp. UMB6358]MDK7229972.1 ABC transporter ATP-binding protein [Pauljensenia sp. UMB1177]QYB15560.1 ABC transporter ATP-binding protein [Schaalia turicensis]
MTLEAKGVRKDFPRVRGGAMFSAVEPVDLRLNPGELLVIRGRSGSGKSTLLSMMAGILAPTEGAVLIDGEDLYALPDAVASALRNERIGVIPQGHTALRSLSVLENVLLPSIIRARVEQEGVRERAEALLEGVDLAPLADARPDELSGGELRRMAVARALVMRPETVLADEPTAGLDAGNAQTVLRMLRRAADEGAAVLVVTHEDEAVHFADRVMVMESGVLRLGDAPRGGSPTCEDLK